MATSLLYSKQVVEESICLDLRKVIWKHCARFGAFSLISWLYFNHFGHKIYQIKAEYLSYLVVSFIKLWIKNMKI